MCVPEFEAKLNTNSLRSSVEGYGCKTH